MVARNPADIDNFYTRLGIDPKSSPEDVKGAFGRVAKVWHPDKNHDPGANRATVALLKAYEVLSDSAKRKAYNAMHGLPFDAKDDDLTELSAFEMALRKDINGFGCTHSNHAIQYDNDCNGKPSYLCCYLLWSDFKDGNFRGRTDLVCQTFIYRHFYETNPLSVWAYNMEHHNSLIDNHIVSLFQVLHNTSDPMDLVSKMNGHKDEVLGEVRQKLTGRRNLNFFTLSDKEELIYNNIELPTGLGNTLIEQVATEYQDLIRIFTPKLVD